MTDIVEAIPVRIANTLEEGVHLLCLNCRDKIDKLSNFCCLQGITDDNVDTRIIKNDMRKFIEISECYNVPDVIPFDMILELYNSPYTLTITLIPLIIKMNITFDDLTVRYIINLILDIIEYNRYTCNLSNFIYKK